MKYGLILLLLVTATFSHAECIQEVRAVEKVVLKLSDIVALSDTVWRLQSQNIFNSYNRNPVYSLQNCLIYCGAPWLQYCDQVLTWLANRENHAIPKPVKFSIRH